ncbi:MAG TPA: response regulator [Caulobacteraceae bacterium]|nr:response regulator [Caulobacteraceae bacterium]
MVVEDDASLLGALTFSLQVGGYAVAGHRTALGALQDERPCDCLVADLKLPDVDGLTLIDRMRARGVQAPAILITTRPDERCRSRAAQAHVLIVEKPLLDGELRQHIANVLERPGRQG